MDADVEHEKAVAAEAEAEARNRPLHVRQVDGGIVAAPNPHAAATPIPFHPPAGPAGPVLPATTPRGQ